MKKRMLALFFLMSLVLAACGEEAGEETTTTEADPGQETTTTAETAETPTTAADTTDGVHVADTDLGLILVDPDGFALYIFTVDSPGESACYDACAELWPPVPADTPISPELDASIFGSAPRTDGPNQLTVNEMPLYLYTPDTSPGDTTGQGFNDVWFVVDAQGQVIEAAAGQGTPIDYGY